MTMRAEELHKKAMIYVDQAIEARLAGKEADACKLRLLAFRNEVEAADAVADQLDLEPTRSVLHRSAATLAVDCGDNPIAEKLIYRALAGNPPEAIAQELKDLLETVSFKRHLDVRGIRLQDDEVQMALVGNAVGFGIAPTDEFISRVASTEKLLFRIAERRVGRPYRDRGRTTSGLRSDLELFVSVPRAASFSVTFRIGHGEQLKLPGMDFGRAVVDEFLEALELFDADDARKLKERIPNEAYLRNFTALARTIAPDGDAVTTVGFTAVREGTKRSVALRRPRHTNLPGLSDKAARTSDELEILTGRLRKADAINEGKNRITVVTDRGGKLQSVVVPPGMMSDIVRPMWDEIVRVTARRKKRILELVDIERAR